MPFRRTIKAMGGASERADGEKQPTIKKMPKTAKKAPSNAPSCSAWIAVNDYMPPIGFDVLTWGRSTIGTRPDVQRVYNDGDWKPTFKKGWNKGEPFEVTHWAKISPPNS